MNRNIIRTAFDIGSFQIKGLVFRIREDDSIEILSLKTVVSKGIENGNLVDKDQFIQIMMELVESLEKESKISIQDDVFITLSGSNIKSVNSSTRKKAKDNEELLVDKKLKQELLNQCSDIQVSADRYVLHNLDQGFYIDGSTLIRNPISMVGKTIEAKAHLIHVPNFNMKQIGFCFENELQIKNVMPVFDGLAGAVSALSEDQKKLGCIFLDIGSDKTNFIAFKDNYVVFSKVIPVGGNLVTKDIAAYLGCSLIEAEQIKKTKLSSFANLADENETFEVGLIDDALTKKVNAKEISKIAELRYEDIIDHLKNIFRINSKEISEFKSGIKLSGGGSNIKNIDLLFKNHFPDLKIEFVANKNIHFKEDLSENRELVNLFGLSKWLIHSVDEDSLYDYSDSKSNSFFKKILNSILNFFE